MTDGFIVELGDGNKDPGYYAQTRFGQGPTATGRLKLLLVGLKASSGGTLTPNTQFRRVLNPDEAATLAGAGGELARMADAAFRKATNCEVYIAAPAAAGGAAAATATITIDGTWTSSGQWKYRVCGDEISDGIASTDTQQSVAEGVRDYINARPRLAVSATAVAGEVADEWVVTLAAKSAGVRGNDYILVQDTSELPSGATSVIAGGSSTTNGGKRFTGGSGTEDIATLLTNEFDLYFDRFAFAQRDASNVAKLEAQVDAKAGPFEQRLQHCVGAFNSASLSTVSAITQTTINDPRFEILWMTNGETPAPEYAAEHAADRASIEEDTPNVGYDGKALPGIRAHTDGSSSVAPDVPDHATRVAALDAGVTPLTTVDGQVVIVRAVTTRSLTEDSTVDDRTVDTSDAWVPDWVNRRVRRLYLEDFKPKNPRVRDDFAPEENPPRRTGIATPKLWKAFAMRWMLTWQEAAIVTKVESNPVVAQFNPNAKRIVSRIPVIPLPLHHQIEVSVEQIPFASAS